MQIAVRQRLRDYVGQRSTDEIDMPSNKQLRIRRRLLTGIAAGGLCAAAPSSLLTACSREQRLSTRFAPGFEGQVLARGDARYEKWRQSMMWQQLKVDRYPQFIARPVSVADVVKALKFASGNKLKVAVRSGGHNVWASFLRDEGLLLDLSEFKTVRVHAGRGRATAGPSLWARDLNAALAEEGEAFPVAHCASVPLGGYLLGGGLGINGDQWGGIACLCVVGAEIVTGDGQRLRVDDRHHPDILWALRGGGAGFPGVVTSFELKTYRSPGGVWTGTYVFPLAALDVVAGFLDDLAALQAANTEILGIMVHNPQAGPDARPIERKACVVRALVFGDDEKEARPVLDFMAAHPAAKQAVFKIPNSPTDMEAMFVESMDWRRGFGFGRLGVENAWINDTQSALRSVAEVFVHAPSWKSHVVVQPKTGEIPHDAGSFSVSGTTYVGGYSVWDEASADRRNLAWLQEFKNALQPHAAGHYINEIDGASDPGRVRRCYSDAAWKRLRAVRSEVDPDGVFHDFPGIV